MKTYLVACILAAFAVLGSQGLVRHGQVYLYINGYFYPLNIAAGTIGNPTTQRNLQSTLGNLLNPQRPFGNLVRPTPVLQPIDFKDPVEQPKSDTHRVQTNVINRNGFDTSFVGNDGTTSQYFKNKGERPQDHPAQPLRRQEDLRRGLADPNDPFSGRVYN